jgi:hypothetical protein
VTAEAYPPSYRGSVTLSEHAEFFADEPILVQGAHARSRPLSCLFRIPNGGAIVHREAWVCVEHRRGAALVAWRVVAGVWRSWQIAEVSHSVPLPSDFKADVNVLEGDVEQIQAALDDDFQDQLAIITHMEREEANRVRQRAREEAGQTGPPPLGFEDILRFPTISYEAPDHDKGECVAEEKVTCVVCLIDFEKGDELRVLPCMHWFHTACCDDWLRRKATCPFCNCEMKELV